MYLSFVSWWYHLSCYFLVFLSFVCPCLSLTCFWAVFFIFTKTCGIICFFMNVLLSVGNCSVFNFLCHAGTSWIYMWFYLQLFSLRVCMCFEWDFNIISVPVLLSLHYMLSVSLLCLKRKMGCVTWLESYMWKVNDVWYILFNCTF